MSKLEQSITGFIIKSQDLGEADLLLTFFSESEGKIRAMVKSAKKMTSKLSGNLQPYILAQVTLVGESSIPKIINVLPVAKYSQIIMGQQGMQVILAMQELVLRALPDGQPNPELFEVYHQSLKELNEQSSDQTNSLPPILTLLKFYILALDSLGFSPRLLDSQASSLEESSKSLSLQIFFSMQNGRFLNNSSDSGDAMISMDSYLLFKKLSTRALPEDFTGDLEKSAVELLSLLTKFAGYQLERELRAPLYFTVI